MKRPHPILWIAVFTLFVGLACAALSGGGPTAAPPTVSIPTIVIPTIEVFQPTLPGGTTVTNLYMARDEEGNDLTTTFAPADDFYVFFDVENVAPNTQFQARWYALNVSDQDPDTPFQTTDYTYETGVGNIYFQLTNSEDWPIADYRVEIYMDGVKVGEQFFSVQ